MTWQLVSRSFRLLREDPKLIVFPILSAIGAAALSLPFLFALFTGEEIHSGPRTWPLVFLWYVGASFVTIFFNCALIACVQMRFAREEPRIAEGLRRAASRLPAILLWALVSSTIGRLLQFVEQRAGWTGRLIAGIFGLSWSMAAYLMLPVLIMENRGVGDSLRRSASLLRETWSEQLVSCLAFGWMGLLFAIPGVVLGALGSNGYPLFIAPAVLWFAAMFATWTAAREIFTAMLYKQAATAAPPV